MPFDGRAKRSGEMTEMELKIEANAIVRVQRKPELRRTGPGFPVCRFQAVADAGPASTSVQMPVYVFGGPGDTERKLALGCANLRVGELVQIGGLQRQRARMTKGRNPKRWLETSLQATAVRLLGSDGRPESLGTEGIPRRGKGLVVHCEMSPYEIYIGRGRDPYTDEWGEWGNCYSHRPSASKKVIHVETAEQAVLRYKADLWNQIQSGELTLERLASLAGKTLGCWCAPACCHGDVLASASVWAVQELARQRGAC
jgi:hypothetical protein